MTQTITDHPAEPATQSSTPAEWSRRSLLVAAAATVAVPAWGRPPARASSQIPPPSVDAKTQIGPLYPTLDPSIVREVVGVAHRDLDRLRELVEPHPELANSAWDWGFGDWETALGAASHVGRPDIAVYLIEKGARPDIFTAAMLGQLDVVRGFVSLCPGIQDRRGPHGIPLLSHARAGGETAKPVYDFLQTLDGAAIPEPPEISDQELERYQGTYLFGPGANEGFIVAPSSMGGIAIERLGLVARRLTFLGDHTFHPAGAPSVQIRFVVDDSRVLRLEVWSPDLVVRAERTD